MSNLNGSLGAMELGILTSIFMFGLFNLQVFVYYRHYPNDWWGIRTLVAVQWILEFIHAILACHTLYTVTISNYATPEELLQRPWSINIVSFLNGVIVLSAQAFFITRIRKSIGSPYVLSLCWTLSLVRFVGATGITIYSMELPAFRRNHHMFHTLLTTVLAINAVVDAIIGSSLCYNLFRICRTSTPRRMTRLVDCLIAFAIPTGLAISIFAVAMFIFSLIPRTSVLTAMMLFEAELFSNSMLANLNEHSMRQEGSARDPDQRSTKSQLKFAHNKTTRLTVVFREPAIDMMTSSNSSSSRHEIEATKPIDV